MSTNQSFGKSIPLEKLKDGQSWKEFNGERPDEKYCVHVGVDNEGMAVISKKNFMASEIINYNIEKLYTVKENGNVAFFYTMKGDMNNCTISELNIIADLLRSNFENDYQTQFQDYNPTMVKCLEVKVNFEKEMIYLFYELNFEKAWKPSDQFKEVQ